MIHDTQRPALRAARPPTGTTRVAAEDLLIGDQVISCGLILDVRTISRCAVDQVEIGWTAGDEHLETAHAYSDHRFTVVLPRPEDGAGVDRFDDELAAAS